MKDYLESTYSETVYASACELSQDIMHKLYDEQMDYNYAFRLLCPEKQDKNSVNFSSNFHMAINPRNFRVNPRTTGGAHIGRNPRRECTNSARQAIFAPGKRIKLGGNTAFVSAPGQV
jgi:hypothetical protein